MFYFPVAHCIIAHSQLCHTPTDDYAFGALHVRPGQTRYHGAVTARLTSATRKSHPAEAVCTSIHDRFPLASWRGRCHLLRPSVYQAGASRDVAGIFPGVNIAWAVLECVSYSVVSDVASAGIWDPVMSLLPCPDCRAAARRCAGGGRVCGVGPLHARIGAVGQDVARQVRALHGSRSFPSVCTLSYCFTAFAAPLDLTRTLSPVDVGPARRGCLPSSPARPARPRVTAAVKAAVAAASDPCPPRRKRPSAAAAAPSGDDDADDGDVAWRGASGALAAVMQRLLDARLVPVCGSPQARTARWTAHATRRISSRMTRGPLADATWPTTSMFGVIYCRHSASTKAVKTLRQITSHG